MQVQDLLPRLLLILLLLNFAACSTLRTVSIEDAMRYSPPAGVDYGSLVHVKTLDQKDVKFRVTLISDEGLGGKQGFYAYSDMQTLKVQQEGESNQNTVGWIIGVLGVASLVALISNADEVRVCSPSPCE